MPKITMLIGIPGVGKSTWIKDNSKPDDVVISADYFVDMEAARINSTYDVVVKTYFKQAEVLMLTLLRTAIAQDRDLIWDQTNTTAKTRRKKINKVPLYYEKHAVVFKTPEPEEHARRLDRPGKTIPKFVLERMAKQFEFPTPAEGWDSITEI